jgi:hypothetical protein
MTIAAARRGPEPPRLVERQARFVLRVPTESGAVSFQLIAINRRDPASPAADRAPGFP